MRTNIVLDDELLNEALKLSGKSSKKEIVNFALQTLVESLRHQSQNRENFIDNYIEQPIKIDGNFSPLSRDEIYER